MILIRLNRRAKFDGDNLGLNLERHCNEYMCTCRHNGYIYASKKMKLMGSFCDCIQAALHQLSNKYSNYFLEITTLAGSAIYLNINSCVQLSINIIIAVLRLK